MNNFKILIGGKDYTNNIPLPFKYQQLLNEQLDEASIEILQINEHTFKPLTDAKIEIYSNNEIVESLFMLVANDKANEIPSGSGKYNHDINLIEYTKWLEGFMCRSQGYVNPLARVLNKTWDGRDVSYNEGITTSRALLPTISGSGNIEPNRNVYYTSAQSGQGKIKSLRDAFDFRFAYDEGEFFVEADIYVNDRKVGTLNSIDATLNYEMKNGENKLRYVVSGAYTDSIGAVDFNFTAEYLIFAGENLEPLPKWNAWEVCQRALNIAEPLRKGENSRFKMDENQRKWLESIETPEFQFTKSNLREILQGVGNYIHAEPRLLPCNDGIYQGIVTFDKYGGGVFSEFSKKYIDYASLSNSIDIESYATNIDSTVGNFVNDEASYIEPYENGYKTVLTEGTYARITNGNMYIATKYPIRSIKKVSVGYLKLGATWEKLEPEIDITPYIFESAEYQQLSTYDQTYPTSKAYAIYYTIGDKGIKGLNFKQESLWGAWENYAIINIISACIGKWIDTEKYDYWSLNFQVEYEPIYSARVQQNKPIFENGKEWTKPYNQGQNLIKAEYYGECLKGVIARMGNIDKTITYVIDEYPTITPKIGELYDANYYISNIATEIQPYYYKTTIALSKDFNKYNQFVGVDATKRMYEVSEQQAFESDFTYRDFVVFGDTDLQSGETLIGEYKHMILAGLFGKWTSNPPELKKITFAKLQGISNNDKHLNTVILPVIRSSFGNACVLVCKYEDNYSAGNYSKYWNENGITGYNAQTYPYADNYGRIKYLKLDFCNNPEIAENVKAEDFLRYPPYGNDDWLKGNAVLSTANKPFLIEKGNTEILSINYQLEFVSAREDIIIGSGLAKKCSLVRDYDASDKVKLYLFKDRLNKFSSNIDITQGKLINTKVLKNGGEEVEFAEINPNITTDDIYQSWAIINTTDNSLLIGCNMTIDKTTTNIFKNGNYNGLKMCVLSEKDLYKGE